LHIDGKQEGPYSLAQLRRKWEMRHIHRISEQTLFWQEGFDEWLPLSTIADMLQPPASSFYAAARAAQPMMESDCSRGIYIILGLFFGLIGVHNFYAGHLRNGALQCILFATLFWTVIVPVGLFVWVVMELFTVTHDGKGRPLK
ncbi:MAG: GYF domain-containing protein, partial [Chthoniobacteraceae bacterium]